jgi:hypothetical protein
MMSIVINVDDVDSIVDEGRHPPTNVEKWNVEGGTGPTDTVNPSVNPQSASFFIRSLIWL